MSVRHSKTRRLFTVEQANAALPLVRSIVRDLTELSREVIERRHRLSGLVAGRPRDACDPYRDELTQIEQELEKDCRRLRGFVEELLELGVEPKSVADGLVDFPTTIDGRPAYLCWKLGEPEVLYWHERDAGFLGRQPLDTDGASGRRVTRTGADSRPP